MGEMVRHRTGYWCEKVHHGWIVRTATMPNGQKETLVMKRWLYIPADIDDPAALVVDIDQSGTLEQERRDAERAERNRERAARRAKERCRLRVKGAGFNELLTLTYRENQTDFALVRQHFAAWLRKMRKALPGFRAVWSFERQQRGAWHVHVATDRLPTQMHFRGCKVKSYVVGTALWRDVVGQRNGTCNVGGRGGRYQRYRSPAKIAGYLAKYLTKDYCEEQDGELRNARRWDSTKGLDKPEFLRLEISQDVRLADVIGAVFELPPGHVIVRTWASELHGIYGLYTEPDPCLSVAH